MHHQQLQQAQQAAQLQKKHPIRFDFDVGTTTRVCSDAHFRNSLFYEIFSRMFPVTGVLQRGKASDHSSVQVMLARAAKLRSEAAHKRLELEQHIQEAQILEAAANVAIKGDEVVQTPNAWQFCILTFVCGTAGAQLATLILTTLPIVASILTPEVASLTGGILVAATQVPSLGAVLFGSLADKWGDFRPVVLLGLCISLVGYIFAFLGLSTSNIYLFVPGWFVVCFGASGSTLLMMPLAGAWGTADPAVLGSLSAISALILYTISPMITIFIGVIFRPTETDRTWFYVLVVETAVSIPLVLCLPRRWLRPGDAFGRPSEALRGLSSEPAHHPTALRQAYRDWCSTSYRPFFTCTWAVVIGLLPSQLSMNYAEFLFDDLLLLEDPVGFLGTNILVGVMLAAIFMIPFGKLLDESSYPMSVFCICLPCFTLPSGVSLYLFQPDLAYAPSKAYPIIISVVVVWTTATTSFLIALVVPVTVSALAVAHNEAHLNRDIMLATTAPFTVAGLLAPCVGYLLGKFPEGGFTTEGRPVYSIFGYKLVGCYIPATEVLLALTLMCWASAAVRQRFYLQNQELL